uniref:Peptidase A1 domain-containing protein n=1 Tax=Ditylenchus dipsaci TaxID=166011 RepID=A0A915E1L0_9BILA
MATVSAQEVGSSDSVTAGAIDVEEKHLRFMKSFEKRAVKPLKFDVYTVRSRLSCDARDRHYQQFFLIQSCVGQDGIKLRLEGKAVCKKFFCAVVALSEHTFNRFIVDYVNGRHQAGKHGNAVAQESPTGNEYYAPPSLTKRECVEIATGNNTSATVVVPTDCFMKLHLVFISERADRKDYAARKIFSVRSPDQFLSVAHDGMTKMHTKIPHLLQGRAKLLADKDLAFCDLNVALVHRPICGSSIQEFPFSMHGYFNLCGANVGGTNSVLSQLLDAVSRTKQISPTVAFQLDNFGPNKSYLLLGALGWFLRAQSVVREFYVAYNEVGHTHIDIDACFGRFSKRLDRSQCPTPQAMKQEFEKLNGVENSTLLYTVYDFDKVISCCDNLLHFIETVAPHPLVLPVDQEKIMKLDGVVEQCCTILSTRELSNIAEAKLAYLSHVGEPFQQMLDRFKQNASVERSEPLRLTDEENQLVGRFLAEEQSAVRRLWNVFDTGSANLWVPDSNCNNCLGKNIFRSNESSSHEIQNDRFSIAYGIGTTAGKLGKDTVRIIGLGGPDAVLTIPNITFGQAFSISSTFTEEPFDGYFGLAFQSLAEQNVEPVLQQAYNQKLLSSAVFTVYLEESAHIYPGHATRISGIFTLGGLDTVSCGTPVYVPLLHDKYYEIVVDQVSVGSTNISAYKSAAISDTGTSLLMGKKAIVEIIAAAVGAIYEGRYGVFLIACNATYHSVTFTIDGSPYSLGPSVLTMNYGGLGVNQCLFGIYHDDSILKMIGMDWILGTPFNRQNCIVYDMERRRIGIAPHLPKPADGRLRIQGPRSMAPRPEFKVKQETTCLNQTNCQGYWLLTL